MRRVGWARHTKTLLDVYLLSTNLAICKNSKKIRQREHPYHVMTIRSSTSYCRRGLYCISSLTWVSCVAYLFSWQPRPVLRVSKSKTPASFLCLNPRCLGYLRKRKQDLRSCKSRTQNFKIMNDRVNFTFSSEEDRDKFVDHLNEYDNNTLNSDARVETSYEWGSDGYTYSASVNRDGIDDAAQLRQSADLMNGKTEFDD